MFPRCNNVVVTIGNCLTAGSCRPETSAHRCLTTHPRTPGTEQCRDGEYRSFNMTTVIMISSDNSIIINSGQDDAKLYRNRTQGYVNLNLTRPSVRLFPLGQGRVNGELFVLVVPGVKATITVTNQLVTLFPLRS